LNKLYSIHKTWAKYDHTSEKFQWVDCDDRQGQTLSFLKFGDLAEDTLLVACNFSDELKHRDWGCPHGGEWRVVMDSDSPDYNGGGSAGGTCFYTFSEARNGQPYGLSFSVSRWSVRILSFVQ
jgi:1,4-alpha-glucan branching enzyme